MPNQFPSSLNAFTNPAGTDFVAGTNSSGFVHNTLHGDTFDAVEAHEAVLGTTAGTSVLKHFAAGHFPIRATGVAATGTLQQTIVGGTLNNNVLGTLNSTGG